MKAAVSGLNTFEQECQDLYNAGEQKWNKWIEDEDLKTASQKVK